ncbi:MAG: TetR/AcrR family transcriptional regulator [Bacillota bacterium]|nr:TetR/AcrR family transcriptional regulator [Bacillota bacterium]
MPTERFCNLPEEKRERITRAALSEYVDKGIDGADVAGVVRRAGIPRGSFYQYFSDMDDLFGHVFNHLTAVKLRYMAGVFDQAGNIPFAEYVEMSFRCGLRFAESHPQFVALGKQVYSSTNPVAIKCIETARRMGVEHYAPLIDRDKARGLIRESIDSSILAAFVMTVYTDVVASVMFGQSGDKQDVMVIADTLFDILRHGIHKTGGAS